MPDWHEALDRELAQALAHGEKSVGDRLEREFERTLILRALAHTGGHRMEAAQRLGWGRNTLTRRIQELGIDPDRPKDAPERRSARRAKAPAPASLDDHRRVIGGLLALARVAVDAAGRAPRWQAPRDSRMWSMRSPWFFGNAS